MANHDSDKIFDDKAIRDTSLHESNHAYIGEFTAETLVFYNDLDQEVSIQYQGTIDDVNWFDIGAPIVLPAGTKDYETVTDFFPEYRVTAQCSVAPTTGVLCVWVLKARS